MYAIDPQMLSSLRNGQIKSLSQQRENPEFHPQINQNPSFLKHNIIRIKTKKATSASLPKIFSLRVTRSIDDFEGTFSQKINRIDSRDVNLSRTILPQFQVQLLSPENHQDTLVPLRKDIELLKLMKKVEMRDHDRFPSQQLEEKNKKIQEQITNERIDQSKKIERERQIEGQLSNRKKIANSVHFKTDESVRTKKQKKIDETPNYYSPIQDHKRKSQQFSNLVQKISINSMFDKQTNPEIGSTRDSHTETFGESEYLSPKYGQRSERAGDINFANAFNYLGQLSKNNQIKQKRVNEKIIDQENSLSISAKSWCIYDFDQSKDYLSKCNTIASEITAASYLMVYYTAVKFLANLSSLNRPQNIKVKEQIGSFPEGSIISISEALIGLILTNRPEFASLIARHIGAFLGLNVSNLFDTLIGDVSSNGAEMAFINQMNYNSDLIGMSQTKFQSIHGDKDQENYASCADIVQLSCACLSIGEFKNTVKLKEYIGKYIDSEGEEKEEIWFNQNKLLEKGFQGIHSGLSIDSSKPYVSSFIKIKDSSTGAKKQLIIVLLDCYTLEDRWTESVKLARYAIKQIGQQVSNLNN